QCRISRKLVDAGQLIRDLFPAALPAAPAQEAQTASRESAIGAESRQVFVSYSWMPESTAVVDEIEGILGAHGITLIRDRNEIAYKDNIRDFMLQLAGGAAVILVISKRYLKSPYCMFELTELAKSARNPDALRRRIFPILLPDVKISNATDRLAHTRFWEHEVSKLTKAIKKGDLRHLQGIHADLDLYDEIRSHIAQTLDLIRYLNTLTLAGHRKSKFKELLAALQSS
ncbi:MAG: toll/interleukin-1 receptor domain-containing protein, partial [Phycisphaerales bacterium]|nr:toll/interleukin-1 receptor domain-containing protein [Phycisphaerales bacterium]